MDAAKSVVINRLKKDILSLGGFKTLPGDKVFDIGFAPLINAFPNKKFPLGCMHEFDCSSENISATTGFIAALLGKMMHNGGVCIWISTEQIVFPSGLTMFGIEPHRIIFINLSREKDVLFATEEALKCNNITTVISEIKNIDFTASRRFQLVAEKSRVTGFLLRKPSGMQNRIATVSKWRITSLPSIAEEKMPGVGFPRWKVELLKIRNGSPGCWEIEWSVNDFGSIDKNIISMPSVLTKIV